MVLFKRMLAVTLAIVTVFGVALVADAHGPENMLVVAQAHGPEN